MSPAPVLVWFRQDLRLADNPAMTAAVESGAPVVPAFVWAPEEEVPWAPGAASQWWLHQSLHQLERSLAERGSRLIVRRGPSAKALLTLATEADAGSVFWNRRYEPAVIARDRELKSVLRERGLVAESFSGNLLFEPWAIQNTSRKPFRVFTAFWKACLAQPAPPLPTAAPKRIAAPRKWPASLAVSDLKLEPKIDWAGGLRETWRPGEQSAAQQLRRFRGDTLLAYPVGRERPGETGTSRLSPHLHFGEISPRQVWDGIHERLPRHGGRTEKASDVYLREIVWREFAHHLLFHFPKTTHEPLDPKFRAFPWRRSQRDLHAWQRGRTGYPLVDAGMRELWHTGWMHNRVRMVVASFLTKHLLLRWQEGAAWFWDTLVDADLANNTLGWQWTAGSGADAAPYFRIFNPVLQGEKFDPDGIYVRRWVPEIAALPDKWIHKPWEAPEHVLTEAKVALGSTYPKPIVDHGTARQRALAAFESLARK